jgi:serine/threonine protein kinase
MTRWFNSPLQLHRRWKNAKKRQIAGRYKLLREIGQGASGVVHLAIEIKTNKHYVNTSIFQFE